MQLNIKDTFNKELPADPIMGNSRRQVSKVCFSYVTPRIPTNPALLHYSPEILKELGLTEEDAQSDEFLNVFSGAKVLEGTNPYAMVYGGHQFGNWAGQLGDGRAINLTEINHNNKQWALQLKGAGETPYSRTADGFAVLRSSIREHLCSEAMHHLGVPSTRSLSLSTTGDDVLRDVLYNGNSAYEKGAVVCRVAQSFVRFGNFQILAARKDNENLKKLTDYTIKQHFPHITAKGKEAYIQFYQEVVNNTLDMILHWQRVGFVHGVMNTDNMSILGQTIDYGPYGWLEGYDPDWTPNTTDAQNKRYRYGNQPNIGLWNLAQLGNALLPIIDDIPALQAILNKYNDDYVKKYHAMMYSKLGLQLMLDEDANLVQDLLNALVLTETDMTIFFRDLARIERTKDTSEEALWGVTEAFYKPEEVDGDIKKVWVEWMKAYLLRLQSEEAGDAQRRVEMNAVNPKYVLRNYMAQLAIDDADKGRYELIDELYTMLTKPYDEQQQYEKWFAKRPDWAREKVGCSMLSCSS